MILYGLKGFTHGGGLLLTLMSPEGRSAMIEALVLDPAELRLEQTGGLAQVHEIADGGLDRLVAAHGILLLDFAAWQARKMELGVAIWR